MNVGEKILRYKEKLNHKNFMDFGRAANCSGSWLNDLSKKEKIKQINDMDNLENLCAYLGITIDQLIKDDESEINQVEVLNAINTNNVEDINVIISNMIVLLQKEDVKFGNVQMSEKSREVCADALKVVRTLVKPHL